MLLLDEAPPSLDPLTEEIIHRVIDEGFTKQAHTLVMIAHRLHAAATRTCWGCNMVVWMEDGGIDRMGSAEEALRSE